MSARYSAGISRTGLDPARTFVLGAALAPHGPARAICDVGPLCLWAAFPVTWAGSYPRHHRLKGEPSFELERSIAVTR